MIVLMTVLLAAISCEIENQEEGTDDKIKNNPQEVIVTGAATDIGCLSAKIYGWCNKNEEPGVSVPFGIEYSHIDLTTEAISLQAIEKDPDNKYCCEAVDLIVNTLYYYRAFALINGVRQYGEVKSFMTKTRPVPNGAIELGLSVMWASCNIGASYPQEYGDYYSWGEVEPKYSSQDPLTWKDGETGYNWASYKWCNGNYNLLTKYCPENEENYWDGSDAPDNKTMLETGPDGDDVASKRLGKKWRMPTSDEWWELEKKCNWTWTDNYNGTGVKGQIVTSQVEGYKEKSIFIPAAGYRKYASLKDVGSSGGYWSSTLDGYLCGPDRASCFDIYSDGVAGGGDQYRYYGYSIRPVSE